MTSPSANETIVHITRILIAIIIAASPAIRTEAAAGQPQ